MEVGKLFNDLESNNLQEVEDTKKKFTENFSLTKDPWLVHGFMDYFSQTNSYRIIDILVKVQPPHDKYIFDRLSEWIRGGTNKMQALTLFGFIVRKHPTWLFKVTTHNLFKDILKLLKTEKDIIPVMSALLCVIILLPIIPSKMVIFLQDLFDIFSHLASWNCHNPSKMSDDYLVHLQIGLYTLFHRLYGMYPCRFTSFIREEFVDEKIAIFTHTIKPLLDTVKIHPMLLTSNKDAEINASRWKNMEPHDVVAECAKFTLDYMEKSQDIQPECPCHTASLKNIDYTLSHVESPMPIQLQHTLRNTQFLTLSAEHKDKLIDMNKNDNLWSPSVTVLATPPPTGTVPHTPTPTPSIATYSSAQTITTVTGATQQLGAAGASPPEAAVEATPETTPMKEHIRTMRPYPANPNTVRSIWGASGSSITSQPSSPMKKEQSPFDFSERSTYASKYPAYDGHSVGTSQKISRMVTDRNDSHMQLISEKLIQHQNSQSPIANVSIPSSPLLIESQYVNVEILAKHTATLRLESEKVVDSTREDLEVTEITNQSQPSTNIQEQSNTQELSGGDCDDCETEGSPCSAGGLHIPNSKSLMDFAAKVKRLRMLSHCVDDSNTTSSPGTSPADASGGSYLGTVYNPLRSVKSLPDLRIYYQSTLLQPQIINLMGKDINGQDSTTPSDEEAISAATHFRQQNQREQLRNRMQLNKRFNILSTGISADTSNNDNKVHTSTQTIDKWPAPYEHLFLDVFSEENKSRLTNNLLTSEHLQQSAATPNTISILKSPHEMLDKYIEISIKKRHSHETKNWEDMYIDQIQLLNLQLQYERHRREVHAERNRRLLGNSRTNRALEQHNDTLRDQVARLAKEIQHLNQTLGEARQSFNIKEQELFTECNYWKTKYNQTFEDKHQLKLRMDNLQFSYNDEEKLRKTMNLEIEAARGELFDLRNEMRQAKYHAEMGQQFREELTRLQSEMIIMGEIHIKCKDKLSELTNLKARDAESDNIHASYVEEIRDLSFALELKSSQLDTAKARLMELEAQLAKRDDVLTEQKRLLKTVKEEYQERIDALEKKYSAQKAIILRMEEHILELYRNQTAVNLATLSPESDRTDHTSPLSLSLASSEGGLSASLRSTTEIRNLQALVVQPNTATCSMPMITMATTTATTTMSSTFGSTSITTVSSGQSNSGLMMNLGQGTSNNSNNAHITGRNANNSLSANINLMRQQASDDIPVPIPGPSQYHYHP